MAKASTAKRKATGGRTSAARKSTAKKPVRKAAAKKAVRKAAPKVAPRKAAVAATRKSGPRVVVADGQPVISKRGTYKDRVETLATSIIEDTHSAILSKIIVDYDALRSGMIRAMGGDVESAAPEDIIQVEGVDVVRGSYATRNLGPELVDALTKNKKGPQSVLRVHPLDFHVLNADSDRINPRDFTTETMRARIAELTADIAVNGVRDPAKAVIRGKRLIAMAGESRWRAVAHSWIFHQLGIIPNAPPNKIMVILSPRGTNDADTVLDVLKDNEVHNLQEIEVARNVRLSHRLGNEPKEIAAYMGKTVAWVHGMIALLEMPQRVQVMISHGEIKVPARRSPIEFAWQAWEQEGHDPDKTVRVIKSAIALAKRTNPSGRVAPRHLRAVGTPSEQPPPSAPATPAAPRPTADATRVVKLNNILDDINEIVANATVTDDGDGFYSIHVTREQILKTLHPRCGMPLPESAKEPEVENKVHQELPLPSFGSEATTTEQREHAEAA